MAAEHRTRIAYASLAVLGVAFVAAVIVSNTYLRGLRLDLTENQLFTLAPGTRSLLGSIDEPIHMYLFFSEQDTADLPTLRSYAARVREMLEEFVAASNGKLLLEELDPVRFSEEEDRAARFGLQPIGAGPRGEDIYFGLAGTSSIGDQAVIASFRPDRETFLEYDLATLVYSLARPNKVVVGLLTGTQMAGGFDFQTQQPSRPWVITQQARQLFEVRTLPASLERIDDDVSVLWLVHPTELDDATLYAIDQFVLRGGRALVFVDPFAEIAASPDPSGLGASASSTLEPLFDAWGIEFSDREVVVDNVYGLSLSGGLRPIRHIGIVGLDTAAMDQEDVVTSGLGSLNLGTAGHFTPAAGATTTFSPLLTSSTEAAVVPADRFRFLADPEDLLDDFIPSGQSYVLAARLEGPISSAFPDGAPSAASTDADGDEDGDAADADADPSEPEDDAAEGREPAHLSGTDAANVIVVGDVDILSDRLWVRVQSFLGQQLTSAFANNGDLLINALDNLSGSAELIGLRSRAAYTRPFTTVEALRREADARYRQTEQRLEAELAETERKLGELQEARDDAGSLLMTPEQRNEIQRFLDEQARIRSDLRTVRRELDRSIERLGTTLKVVNIAGVPLLLTIVALVVVFLKRSRVQAP